MIEAIRNGETIGRWLALSVTRGGRLTQCWRYRGMFRWFVIFMALAGVAIYCTEPVGHCREWRDHGDTLGVSCSQQMRIVYWLHHANLDPGRAISALKVEN